MTFRTSLSLAAAVLVACASGDAGVASLATTPESLTAEATAAPPSGYLLFTDRSVSAQSADAYRYSVTEIAGAIRATAKPGDVIRVYPIQANTAENTPVYDVTLPALTLSAAELKDLESTGIKSREALLADKRRAFDRAISVGAGKLQALAKTPNTATQNWTDILGAFALARNLQSAGTGTVDLHMQSDMVHSVKGDDLTRARLRDAATALALGKSSAVSFRQNALVRGLRWDQLTLHVYFPESLDRPDAYPSLVRAYWEGFAEAVGMEVVF